MFSSTGPISSIKALLKCKKLSEGITQPRAEDVFQKTKYMFQQIAKQLQTL